MHLKREEGAAAIEFALLLPLLMLILFGIIEFGLVLYNQEVITNASREGARYGIVIGSPRPTTGQIQGVAKELQVAI
jgi:Flp pilus assembly protein TadG